MSVDGGATAQYRYDHQNRRVRKTIGSTWTHYVWEGSQVIGEHDATTAYSTNPTYQAASARVDYIYSGARLIQNRQRTTSTGPWTSRYYLSDGLSTRMTLDGSGNVLGRQAHLPFGEDFAESATQEKHHLTSYDRDAETNTDYAVNRQYGQSIGRFNRPDPYEGSNNFYRPQSLNRFAYVQGNPINATDPTGLNLAWDCWVTVDGGNGDPLYWTTHCRSYNGPDSGGGGGGNDGGGGQVSPPQPKPLSKRKAKFMDEALDALNNYFSGSITEECAENVVAKLAVSLGGGFDLSAFKVFTQRGTFYDGTQSNIAVAGNITPKQPADILYGPGATVADVFQNMPGTNALTSITASTWTSYFRPGNDANGNPVIDSSNGGNNPRNLSLLFHEALHGFTGKGDEDIQAALGLLAGASGNITDYIRNNCF